MAKAAWRRALDRRRKELEEQLKKEGFGKRQIKLMADYFERVAIKKFTGKG
jgi:hypothetical protein